MLHIMVWLLVLTLATGTAMGAVSMMLGRAVLGKHLYYTGYVPCLDTQLYGKEV